MDFLKKIRKGHKQTPLKDSDAQLPQDSDTNQTADALGKSISVEPEDHNDNENEDEDDDDDDFITNEVKRRLKELRRNSFMVLIPEETCHEEEEDDEEEEGETSSADWRDVEAEGRQFWSGFAEVYDKYCERMLVFDRLSAQQLNDIGSQISSTPSPRFTSKKLASPLRCLSLKKIEEPEDEIEQLQELPNSPLQDLEVAYAAHICLTWELLHCQYTHLSQKISVDPENSCTYNYSAQQFQQFQVLLQRFVENEPFQQGLRPEIYAQTRKLLPKLLHVPIVQGSDKKEVKEEESDLKVLAPDLLKTIESSILTFHLFLKMDKRKSGGVRDLFGGQTQLATPLQQVQSSLKQKEIKLKELRKKRKGWKKKSWPAAEEDVELLLGLIDVKILRRVLRMARISREQLLWCEEKMKKLDLSKGKLQRDPSPILFPC
ncbi:Calcium sensing receptor like [Heracleum sosnowskyi]|uniref:Calcium sensing receptor like n=1 Tax=Heracleum sosnowskyi TaxID=360622 RepID=A0AAD8M5Y7_9APIA|nr:Calcium sensing receptor like [Heracleum sosnowskyi]